MDRWHGRELLGDARTDGAVRRHVVGGRQIDKTQLGKEPGRGDSYEPDEQAERGQDCQHIAPLRKRLALSEEQPHQEDPQGGHM